MMILAGGHYKQTQSNYIIAASINIIVSVLAVRKWGLVGVAVGTVIAMFYQTVWMALYDSRNLIQWPFRNFLKQMFVDIISVVGIHVATTSFIMTETNYVAWVILAVKVAIVACLVIVVVNMIFYRSNMLRVIEKIKRIVGNIFCKR